LRILYKGK